MSNSDIEQSGTVKGHLPNGANLSGKISNGLSLSGHISIGGSGDFIIKMTVEANGDGYTVTSCDATVEQIDAAVAAEKRVVVIASLGSKIFELPMLTGEEGGTHYFGTFLFGQVFTSIVYKVAENESEWVFDVTKIDPESVYYFDRALPNISTVGGALNELVPKSHSHDNKDVLDKLSVLGGKLQYNGSDVGLKGDKGDKGDTPVKGTDYWTAADKTEIVNDTLAALPTWTGGSY